jgi:hypothetical protein
MGKLAHNRGFHGRFEAGERGVCWGGESMKENNRTKDRLVRVQHVRHANRPDGVYTPATSSIEIRGDFAPEDYILLLLHETGHALEADRGHAYTMVFSERIGVSVGIALLQSEARAWKHAVRWYKRYVGPLSAVGKAVIREAYGSYVSASRTSRNPALTGSILSTIVVEPK